MSAVEKRVNVTVLNTTSDENNDELDGSLDDGNMEDGETGFDDGSAQVRNIRNPGQIPRAHDHTSTVQIMLQVLCDGTRRKRTAQEIGCPRRFRWSAARVNGLRVFWREGI